MSLSHFIMYVHKGSIINCANLTKKMKEQSQNLISRHDGWWCRGRGHVSPHAAGPITVSRTTHTIEWILCWSLSGANHNNSASIQTSWPLWHVGPVSPFQSLSTYKEKKNARGPSSTHAWLNTLWHFTRQEDRSLIILGTHNLCWLNPHRITTKHCLDF